MARPRAANDSFCNSCSPVSLNVAPAGRAEPWISLVASATTSARSRPNVFAPITTAYWRLRRVSCVGPLAGSRLAIWRSAIRPRDVGTGRSRIRSRLSRSSGRSCTRMSASGPSPRNLAISLPSTNVRTVLPTAATLTPRSAARLRSTTSSISGLPGLYDTSMSTRPGTCRSRSASDRAN